MARSNYIADLAEAIRSRVDPAFIPDENVDELFSIYAVLALSLGLAVNSEDVHDAWCAWMTVKDPNHASLVPYAELDPEAALADRPFVEAIRMTVTERRLFSRPREP